MLQGLEMKSFASAVTGDLVVIILMLLHGKFTELKVWILSTSSVAH